MDKPEAQETFGSAIERAGLLAFGAVLTRFGGDKPMTVDFWVLFLVAVVCIFGQAALKHVANMRKWRRANELLPCSKCQRMLKRESMRVDDVEEKLYCPRCEFPQYQLCSSDDDVDNPAKALT